MLLMYVKNTGKITRIYYGIDDGRECHHQAKMRMKNEQQYEEQSFKVAYNDDDGDHDFCLAVCMCEWNKGTQKNSLNL